MTYLVDEDRARIRRGLARYWSRFFEPIGVSKADLRAAVDATDVFVEDNQVAYNSVLPEAAQTELAQAQKTLLFCAVALARVDIPMLRRVFGEVD